MGLIKLLFSVDGRISRKPFWMFFLSLTLLELLLLFILRNADTATLKNAHRTFIVVVFYPSLAVQIKRWHDRNKSAGSVLINLIPYVGILWAFIELGFFDGTPGDNRYGPDPLGRAAPASKIKIYIDAQTTPYLIEVFMFIVFPCGMLYLLIRSLIKGDTSNAIVASLLIVLSLPLFFLFKWLRKYRAYKIATDDAGLIYYGLLKKIQSRWEDVFSVNIENLNMSKVLRVETRQGNFYFPLTMKEHDKEYPRLRPGMDDYKWSYEDGKAFPITPENCTPYLEIKERIREKDNERVHSDAPARGA